MDSGSKTEFLMIPVCVSVAVMNTMTTRTETGSRNGVLGQTTFCWKIEEVFGTLAGKEIKSLELSGLFWGSLDKC